MAYNLGSARGIIDILYKDGGAKRAGKDLDNLGKKGTKSGSDVQKAATVAGAAGGLIAAGLFVAVKAATNFDKSLSGIKAVSGATAQQMELVRAKALQIGKDTAFGASEAADGIGELVKAGVSVQDALNGAADATVALAAAGGISLPEAAKIAANSLNQFGLTAKQLPGTVDLIAGAANASAIDVHDFGLSLSQAGAVAHLVGLSFKDTAVAIALMGQAGIKGSDAGTSLKTFLTNLIPTTSKQIKLSKELGLITKDGSNAFFDSTGKVKSLADISQVLQTALKGQSKEQQLATLNTLFGSDAIRAAGVIADGGAAKVNKMTAEMSKIKAVDVGNTKLDNLSGDIERLRGSVETLGINLGAILIPRLRGLAQAVDSILGKFIGLSSGTQQNIVTGALWAAGLLLGMAAIVKLVTLVGNFAGIMAGLARALRLNVVASALWNSTAVVGLRIKAIEAAAWLRSAAAAVANRVATLAAAAASRVAAAASAVWAAATGLLSVASLRNAATTVAQGVAWLAVRASMIAGAVATGIVTAAQWALNVALTANPIGLIIVAIIALVAVFVLAYQHSTTFRNIVNAVFNAMRTNVLSAINIIRAVIAVVWPFISRVISTSMAISRAVVSAVFNFIRSHITGTASNVRGAVSAMVAFIVSRINAVRAIVGIITGAFNAVVAAIRGRIGAAVAAVGSIVSGIVGRVSGLAGALAGAGRSAIQGLLNGISSMAGAVIQKARDIASSVAGAIKGALSIHSPSKVMADIGVEIPAGIIVGMQSMANKLAHASLEMANIPVINAGIPLGALATPAPIHAGAPQGGSGGGSQTVNVTVNVPNAMSPYQVAQYTAQKVSTALSTRTVAPRIAPSR